MEKEGGREKDKKKKKKKLLQHSIPANPQSTKIWRCLEIFAFDNVIKEKVQE